MTQTSVSDYLTFCSHIVIHVLQDIVDARIRWPTEGKVQECQEAECQWNLSLPDVWCSMDGIKLMIECAAVDVVQSRLYNAWTCDHYLGAVLVFYPDGTIQICCYNVPGAVHDSNIALIGNILESVYNATGGKCTVDLAFACNNNPFLIKSCKLSLDMTFDKIIVAKDSTSMQQSWEWGM